jgi:hypothetical protein
MSQTHYACGCVETDGVRALCAEHLANPPVVEARAPKATPPEEARRIKAAEDALARGEDPEDTRTAAEKKADAHAAKDDDDATYRGGKKK